MSRPPLSFLALMLPLSIAAMAQQPQFRTAISQVRLEVSVTDARGAVRGLRATDFVVEDAGRRQVVEVEEVVDAPLDLVLVAPPLSTVAFIAADQTTRVEIGLKAFLARVEGRDRLGVVVASAPPRRLRSLAVSASSFDVAELRKGDESYSTSFDAIALGLRVFDDAERRRALVAFTQATDFRSVITLDGVAELAGRLGPPFVLVGVPVNVQRDVRASAVTTGGKELDSVTGHVSGSVFPAALERLARRSGGVAINLGSDAPAKLMDEMFAWLRTHYVLTYKLPPGSGWHPVNVRANRRGVKVRVREGYSIQ